MTICTLGYGGRIKEDILSLLRSADLLPGEIAHFHFPGFYYTPGLSQVSCGLGGGGEELREGSGHFA
jgi:hypothetical protein